MKLLKNEIITRRNVTKKRKLKRLLQVFLSVRGIAICFVVAGHAAIGLIAAELNMSSYENISSIIFGNWQIVSVGKSLILELARCAVPLFIFLAGYHLARSPRTWVAIWNNSKKYLVPMVFWSLVAWGISWRKGFDGWNIEYFLTLFLSGRAQLGYYFIILIIQYYILSRWMVPAMERAPKLIIIVSILLQLLTHVYSYGYLFEELNLFETSKWLYQFRPFPEYLFPRFLISFSLGIWASKNTDYFKRITEKYFPVIILIAALAAVLLFIEFGYIFGVSYNHLNSTVFKATTHAWVEWKFSTVIWTIAAVFLIIAASRRWLPFKKWLELFGKYSFQIFLLHGMILRFMTLVGYKYGSNFHWFGIAGFIIRFIAGLGVPLLIINLIRRWAPKRVQFLLLGF